MECKLDNVAVNYKICGEGRQILMLHGYYPDHRLMEGCMEPIFAHRSGWQRIYLDLPGMGKTKGESWIKNSDDILKIVVDFVENVIPNQHFSIVGESYGGYLAQGLVTRKRELIDGLVLICPAVIANSSKRNVPEHSVLVNDTVLLSSLTKEDAAEFKSMAVVQNQKNWERYRDEILSGVLVADELFLERIKHNGYEFSFDIHNLSEPFSKPILILAGRQDSSVGYRDVWDIVENYPRGTFVVLDMAGHNLQIEQETLFSAMVNEWLNRVEEHKSNITLL
jgi:pimeloyl-ACP methyl ester carboxylesterase